MELADALHAARREIDTGNPVKARDILTQLIREIHKINNPKRPGDVVCSPPPGVLENRGV